MTVSATSPAAVIHAFVTKKKIAQHPLHGVTPYVKIEAHPESAVLKC